ncbi:Protein of uncharacterised function (DUF551) [Yersinia frederiksenii]|nr:Protein of uncharacterised function (DUF551) [Yersinia frederiksenii]
MKELDQFTVERLEKILQTATFAGGEELKALARIALSAKQAEPVGWIKCSDRMPENSNAQCFVYCKDSLRRTGYFDGDDWAINGKYYDESFVTHWQKFPAAPTSLLEGE